MWSVFPATELTKPGKLGNGKMENVQKQNNMQERLGILLLVHLKRFLDSGLRERNHHECSAVCQIYQTIEFTGIIELTGLIEFIGLRQFIR